MFLFPFVPLVPKTKNDFIYIHYCILHMKYTIRYCTEDVKFTSKVNDLNSIHFYVPTRKLCLVAGISLVGYCIGRGKFFCSTMYCTSVYSNNVNRNLFELYNMKFIFQKRKIDFGSVCKLLYCFY